MLPKKVPKSRIIAYNYDSKWHRDALRTRLRLCGEELVDSIHSFRQDIQDRPIVFVGHSLGGLVIVDVSSFGGRLLRFLTNYRSKGPFVRRE
jgi:pimeloyl-ACP methyl ester carboxylesterase